MSKFAQEKYDTVKKLGLYSPSQNGVKALHQVA